MINLIPNQEKKRKIKDFYFRLAVVFLTTLAFSLLFLSVAILPAYFLSAIEKNLASGKLLLQEQESKTPAEEALSIAVSELDAKLRLVENAEQNKYPVSQKVIGAIMLRKMSDIKITKITYESSGGGKKVSISGLAPSRERLLMFRRALENDTAWSKVELPIQNFIKGSNIQFYLSLTPA